VIDLVTGDGRGPTRTGVTFEHQYVRLRGGRLEGDHGSGTAETDDHDVRLVVRP
jgi:hypothetical protein